MELNGHVAEQVARYRYGGAEFEFDPSALSFARDRQPIELKTGEARDSARAPAAEHINFITLNIAHDCNMACPYCFAKQGLYGGPRKLMKAETAYRTVDWLLERSRDKQDCYLRFLGGEPFLNVPVMAACLDYGRNAAEAAGKRIHFSVNTNGTIWNAEIARLLREYDVGVSISMDGTRDAHNVHRIFRNGKGTFDVVAANARKFLNHDPFTMVNATVTVQNVDVYDYVCLFREMGFKTIRFAMVGTSTPGVAVRHQALLEHIEGQYDKVAKLYLGDLRAGDIWYLADFYKYVEGLLTKRPRFNRCGAGTNYLNVDVDGNTHLCHRFTADKTQQVGSITRSDLTVPESILRRDQVSGELPAHRSGSIDAAAVQRHQEAQRVTHRNLDRSMMFDGSRPDGPASPCVRCDIRFLCGGSCFHDGEILFGNLHGGPDAFKCEVDRHLARITMWLLSEISTMPPGVLDEIRGIHRRSLQHQK